MDCIGKDDQVVKAVAYLRPRLPSIPTVGIILGSGMGAYAEIPPMEVVEQYNQIPGFTPCRIEGHRGHFVFTDRCGIAVAILQGRIHRYEGHSLETVTRPIKILGALGVRTLILTCAAGSLVNIPIGHLMVVTDHVNLMGDNPLIGLKTDNKAPSPFIDMTDAYDPYLLQLAGQVAKREKIPPQHGVLACVSGPTFETKAEAAMLKQLGAHAVTMSTVPEVIVARAMKLSVLALALVTNEAGAGEASLTSHEQVVTTSISKNEMMRRFLDGVLKGLALGFKEPLQ